ncbi:hypothetical protein [Candidatus Methylomicrobium oryzae]|uniref:hypothetical protein n=1 Tax=Candidatus Methylomicrobium oryzae TaxID=2802053 RepID=UPI001923FB44|nr:hypothetical protein [Methylomicrobium sp. RS1]MBL1265419.1 hypothetical protein [Methylomicrobium sp. RS1]
MNKPTFWEGVAVALFAGIAGAGGFYAFAWVFSEAVAIRVVIGGLAFAYVFYLLGRSPERIGRATVLLAGGLLSAAVWLFYPPLFLFLLAHALYVWLIRTLYFHSRLFFSLADLGLCLFGIASAFWAFDRTGSLFMAFWCFFLIQALFGALSGGNPPASTDAAFPTDGESDFNRAYRAAEAAVRKLSNAD